jgi:hypothetical protein
MKDPTGKGKMQADDTPPPGFRQQKGFDAIRKTCADFGATFSKGTSAIADVILDTDMPEKKKKFAKVGLTSATLMKDLFSGLSKDLKETALVDILADTAFEMGRFAAAVQNVGGKVWEQVADKLDEDKR